MQQQNPGKKKKGVGLELSSSNINCSIHSSFFVFLGKTCAVTTGETFLVILFGINITCGSCTNAITFLNTSNKYLSSFEDSKLSIETTTEQLHKLSARKFHERIEMG